MKTITNKQKNKSVVKNISFLILALGAFNLSNAQFSNNGIVHVTDGSNVYIGSGVFNLATGSLTTTTRLGTYGKFIFASGVTSTVAAAGVNLNGYGSSLTAGTFFFPVGQGTTYAPVQVVSATASTIDAAYFRANPITLVGAVKDALVKAVSTTEYWRIAGTAAPTLSLTWRSDSGLAAIGVGNPGNLTIVGFSIANSEWEKIPSVVQATSITGGTSDITTTGSIVSLAGVDLTKYEYFSLGVGNIDCLPLVAASTNIKTYNGGWTPSAPTISDPAIINSAYSDGSFACNSLMLNANVTLADGENVEVNGDVSGLGKIIMASTASVVQRDGNAAAPNIELTKRTRSLTLSDVVYWGTPIAGNFFDQLAGAKASTATLADAFRSKTKWVAGPTGSWQPLTAIETGRGFYMRVKAQLPFLTAGVERDFIDLKLTGQANNGDLRVSVVNSPSFPNSARSHNFLANPYPSALDANKFLSENADIDGVLYVWEASRPNTGIGYIQADYLVYTLAGTVLTAPVTTKPFVGKVSSGQGFMVKALKPSGEVLFNNCMRVVGENDNFKKVRNTSASSADSFKLNMTGANGVYSQILVSYMPEGTLDYDRLYDAGRFSVSTAQLFSTLEGTGQKLAINARPSFDPADVVSIGMTKTGTDSETFTIAIDEKTGVFTTPEQSVYIHDTVNNTYHDLNNGDFSFTTDANVLDRYKLVYTAATLSNPKFEANGVIASLNNNVITLQSSLPLTGIEVYDLTGRKILDSKINNTLSSTTSFQFPKAVYIVKAKLDNGTVASFKLINK